MVFNSIWRRKSRMLIALLAIGIGATILYGLMTIYYDIPRQLGKEFRSYGANVVILPNETQTIDLNLVEEIENSIGKDRIVGMAPYHYYTTKVNEQPYILAGTNLEEAKKNSPFWYVEGEWLASDQSDKVMIGKEISDKLDLHVGDSIRVQGVKNEKTIDASSQTKTAEENKLRDIGEDLFDKKYEIAGVATTGGAEEEFIFLDIHELNRLIEDDSVCDMIEGSVEAERDELQKLSSDLSEKYPSIAMRPVRRVTQSQDQVLGKLQALVYLVTVIVLIITMISVSTTMMAIVLERSKEIGLKKALGAPNGSIIKEFVVQSVVLGILGGTIGIILGFEFAQQVSLRVFGRAIHLQVHLIPLTIISSALITALASIWPIRKVLDIHPAIVLKGE